MPYPNNFCNKIPGFKVSNALDKSTNIPIVYFFSSIDSAILSHNSNKARSVEKFWRYPYCCSYNISCLFRNSLSLTISSISSYFFSQEFTIVSMLTCIFDYSYANEDGIDEPTLSHNCF